MKDMENRKNIPVEVELTDGYEKRFTTAILKIYEKRKRQQDKEKVRVAG